MFDTKFFFALFLVSGLIIPVSLSTYLQATQSPNTLLPNYPLQKQSNLSKTVKSDDFRANYSNHRR